VVSEINTLIDEGKFAEAEAKLAYLERVRQVTLLINPQLTSAIPTTVDGRIRGGRAIGGPVSPGGLYEVNENGSTEVLEQGGRTFIIPSRNARVTPAAAGAAGPTVTIINNRRDLTSADVAQAIQMARLAR
jgi:hypothetical protein